MTAMTAKVYIVYFLPLGRWSLFCTVPIRKYFCCDKPTKESNTDRSVTTLKESIVVTGIKNFQQKYLILVQDVEYFLKIL